ncbi:MAG: plastocyanin/azurin family copper-binding protein [Gemmatimonadota bacterium]|nr:plastocyanin/azurin family copper-binding protein [Gemmatimonadota bacterium]
MGIGRTTLVAAFTLALISAGPAVAQPLNERTVNVEGTWTTPPHALHFLLSHRFETAGSDANISDLFTADAKVVNYPTFTLSYGLFEGAHLGVRYSSNAVLVGQSNEWQPFVRVTPFRSLADGRLSVGFTGAWNAAANSADGEVAVQADVGILRLIAAGRAFSNPFDRTAEEQSAEFAAAGGAVLRVNRFLSFTADYANMFTQADAQIAWSAGLAFRIPATPHTLAFFATNVTSGTLQGRTVGIDGAAYWGFEFTIPFTAGRWGQIVNPPPSRPAPPPSAAVSDAAAAPMGPVVEIEISSVSFGVEELEITVGTTVRWVNRDPIEHTTTSSDGLWASPLIPQDGVWDHTFTEAGRFEYYCTPHAFMNGAIVVKEIP